jgi:hypothetical protein
MQLQFNLDSESAVEALKGGATLSVRDGKLVIANWQTCLVRRLFSSYEKKEVTKVTKLIKRQLEVVPRQDVLSIRKLGELYVFKHAGLKAASEEIRALDLALNTFRPRPTTVHPENTKRLERWERYGFPRHVFFDHPELVDFILSSPLGSQIKVCRQKLELIHGQPYINCDGALVPYQQILARFEVKYAPQFSESFLVDKVTHRVYTYLDNGRGLQAHHPYLDLNPAPFSNLSEPEYQRTLEVAQRFVRPGEEGLSDEERQQRNSKRSFVLQIVSSKVKGLNWNASELLSNRKHPWTRLILGQDNAALRSKKGDVFELGFGWESPVILPAVVSSGRFRNQDTWNYKACDKRYVTNIAISREEAENIYHKGMELHADHVNLGVKIGFKLNSQNCTSFPDLLCRTIGIPIETKQTIDKVIARISPDWIKAAASWTTARYRKLKARVSPLFNPLPSAIRKPLQYARKAVLYTAKKITGVVAALGLTVPALLLGGAFGVPARAFEDEREGSLEPLIRRPWDWLRFNTYSLRLPGILQEWQLKQASTVEYHRPTELSIVPHADA